MDPLPFFTLTLTLFYIVLPFFTLFSFWNPGLGPLGGFPRTADGSPGLGPLGGDPTHLVCFARVSRGHFLQLLHMKQWCGRLNSNRTP